jgi:hypothetical protein
MAQDFHFAAELSRLIHDTYGRLFDGHIETGIMFHAALLHQMLVAVSTQTTFTISLKRSALAVAAGRPSRPNTPSDAFLLKAISYPAPISRA